MAPRAIAPFSQLGMVRLRQSSTAATMRPAASNAINAQESPPCMGEALDGLAFETVTGAMADPPFDRRAVPAEASFSTWTASDGWRLRRIDWPQPRDAKSRGSLLFVGGRGDFIEKYLEIQNHWFRRGWNVTAFDWRGQGGSRGGVEGVAADSFDAMVDDLAGLAADWREAFPAPHVAVGH